MVKPEWGNRYICFKCNTRFYDLQKPAAVCPKCGTDQAKKPVSFSSAPSRARTVIKTLVPEDVEIDERAEDEFGELGDIGLDEIEQEEGEEEI